MSNSPGADVVDRARQFANDVLRPAAGDVDGSSHLPSTHLKALAAAGLFGTLRTDDPARATIEVGEIMAAACLATTFVWAQHQGALLRLGAAPVSPERDRWLAAALTGDLIAGVSFAGLASHGETLTTRDGAFFGVAPFVTGWSTIDLLVLWAADPARDRVLCFGVPRPRELSGVRADRLRLIAADASDTCRVTFDGVSLSDAVVLASIDRTHGETAPVPIRRHNATLALGLLRGVVDDLGGRGAWPDRLQVLRRDLDTAAAADDAAAMDRARGALLASVTAAAYELYLAGGARSAVLESLGGRRLREAAFVQSAATLSSERAWAADCLTFTD